MKMTMKTITIKVVPPSKMRYVTVGDWQWDDVGNLTITVADCGDWKSCFAIAVHELIEVVLCRAAGITQEEVDKFDLAWEGEDAPTNEPGDDPCAPYNKQHQWATYVERLVILLLDMDWERYSFDVDSTHEQVKKALKK